MSFWRRPQAALARRVFFQVHVWTGLVIALYAMFIGLTGALLMFRPELQARAYPRFFAPAPDGAVLADPAAVLASLTGAYPDGRFSGIEYPSHRRGTFLAYVAVGDELKTVFADPTSGRILGELPHDGWIQQLQELHFDLLSGSTGYIVNGIAASCLLAMCLTGLVIWWPGIDRVRQAFIVHISRGWKRVVWELHGAVAIWASALLIVWAASGIYFSFPGPVRTAVAAVAPLTGTAPPSSRPSSSATLEPATFIAAAQTRMPRAQVARLIVPSTPTGAFGVVLARGVHGDWDSSDEVTIYFDRYSGEWLQTTDNGVRTGGDIFMTWLGLLHVGNFGGPIIKLLWALTGLAFPVLGVTGFIMWWNRFVRAGRRPGPAGQTRQGHPRVNAPV